MAFGHIGRTAIEYKFRVVFVYGVICEMHTYILHVIFGRRLILLRSKPSKPLMIDIQSQRVDTGNQDVHS